MKKLQIVSLATIASFVLLLSNCKHEPVWQENNTGNNSGNNNNGGGTQTVDTSICFERDILPIFQSNCAQSGCHNATTRAEGYNLTSYATITSRGIIPGNATSSKIMREINSNSMPPYPNPPLTAEQKALIKRWINEGAKNGTNCPPKCDSNSYTFSKNIQPIIQNKCVGCHNSGTKSGNIDLSNYNGVKATVTSGRLWGSINGLSGYVFMPSGGNKLSNCELAQFRKWINAGAPNN